MGVFKCQACGNLHGAPVEHCGVCGSPSVVAVDNEGNPFVGEPPAPGAAPPGLAFLRERDEAEQKRRAGLDEDESTRRDHVCSAKVSLLEAGTALCEALTKLATAATFALPNVTGDKPQKTIVE